MRNVKALKGLLNPELNTFGSNYVAFGQHDRASGMLQAFKHRESDQARADPFQTIKLQP